MRDPTAHSDSETGCVEVKNTTCYMCACRCGIRITPRDGEIRYIEGNPDHPLNKGVICTRGAFGIMKQYSPGRLTKPLLRKRKALRGEGKFEEISWEQAFDILGKRLEKIHAEDPKKFALFTGRDQMQALTVINFTLLGGYPDNHRNADARCLSAAQPTSAPRIHTAERDRVTPHHHPPDRAGRDGRLVQYPGIFPSPVRAHGRHGTTGFPCAGISRSGAAAGRRMGMSSETLPVLAFVIQYLGLLIERWYFFVEARHPQNRYYQSIA